MVENSFEEYKWELTSNFEREVVAFLNKSEGNLSWYWKRWKENHKSNSCKEGESAVLLKKYGLIERLLKKLIINYKFYTLVNSYDSLKLFNNIEKVREKN